MSRDKATDGGGLVEHFAGIVLATCEASTATGGTLDALQGFAADCINAMRAAVPPLATTDEGAPDCTCYRGCEGEGVEADAWHQHADDLCPLPEHAGRIAVPVEAVPLPAPDLEAEAHALLESLLHTTGGVARRDLILGTLRRVAGTLDGSTWWAVIDDRGEAIVAYPPGSRTNAEARASRYEGTVRPLSAPPLDAPGGIGDLDAIEARANAATAGPWEPRRGDGSTSGFAERNPGTPIVTTYETIFAFGVDIAAVPVEADRDFIAAARADVPALVSEVRRLRALSAAPGGDVGALYDLAMIGPRAPLTDRVIRRALAYGMHVGRCKHLCSFDGVEPRPSSACGAGSKYAADLTGVARALRAPATAPVSDDDRAFVRRWLGTGEPSEDFEPIGDWFRRETGMLRPGKDDAGMHSRDERERAWSEWCEAKRLRYRAIVGAMLDERKANQ